MSIEPSLVRKTDDLLQQFDAFIRTLNPTDEESGRFYHIVSALSEAAKSNYLSLRKTFEADEQVLLAWSCRNLLEIAIFTKFAIMSRKNADEFAADRLIDGLQISKSLKKFDLHLNPEVRTSALDAVIEKFEKQMSEQGITRTRYCDARELAEQTGMLEEYETINKVCSKFVHPTAWFLLTSDVGSERFPDARDLFYVCGAKYFATVCAEIAPHIRRWGMRHKPSAST